MHTTTTQAEFLGNGSNKSDADAMIVSSALELADHGNTVVLVGTYTDLLVMLVARGPSNAKLFMLCPSANHKPAKSFNISAIQQAIGEKKHINLLFLSCCNWM